jgi:hypothetical protein
VLGVFIGMIPFLGIVLTGALGVFFYRRESGFTIPAALGSRLGGAAGVVAFAINALLITIRIFVFHAQQEYTDAILKVAQRFGDQRGGPWHSSQHPQPVHSVGVGGHIFFGMIVTLVLASVGGALAALFTRPRTTGL